MAGVQTGLGELHVAAELGLEGAQVVKTSGGEGLELCFDVGTLLVDLLQLGCAGGCGHGRRCHEGGSFELVGLVLMTDGHEIGVMSLFQNGEEVMLVNAPLLLFAFELARGGVIEGHLQVDVREGGYRLRVEFAPRLHLDTQGL